MILQPTILYFTYLQLKSGADAKKLEAKFPSFIQQYAGKKLKAFGFDKKQFLVPLKKIHLDEDVKSNITQWWQCSLFIYTCFNCFIYIADCLHQLYESCHGTISKTFFRSRYKKSIGCRKRLIDNTISW